MTLLLGEQIHTFTLVAWFFDINKFSADAEISVVLHTFPLSYPQTKHNLPK